MRLTSLQFPDQCGSISSQTARFVPTMPQPSVLLKVEVCRRCLKQLAHAAFGETSWFPCEPCRGELDRFLRGWEQRQAHIAQLDRRMEALR